MQVFLNVHQKDGWMYTVWIVPIIKDTIFATMTMQKIMQKTVTMVPSVKNVDVSKTNLEAADQAAVDQVAEDQVAEDQAAEAQGHAILQIIAARIFQ